MTEKTDWLTQIYDDYDAWKGWSEAPVSAVDRDMMDIELRRTGISPPGRVLEIGFGTGTFLLHLQSRGFECWGIERREEYNGILMKSGITVRSGDVAKLPEKYFDLVFAMDVFEHLTKPELLAILKDVRRVLKPGGRLLARFPNGASPFGAMNQAADLTHLTALSISSFSQACSVAQLRFVGGWNSAVSWRASGWLRSFMKPAVIIARRAMEVVLGVLYFGERRPLDMNVTVCAERDETRA